MNITKLVKDVKENKNEESFNKIVKYYEEDFCSKVVNNYGEEYKSKAKEVLPTLVKYYFDNNIKETIWNFLRKKSCNIFNISYSFDDIIKSERKEQIKNHYINKFYVDIQKENTKTCLTKEELLKLSKYIVSSMYDNYISSEKKSHVSSYFDALIRRKVKLFNDEEKLLLYYTGIFGANSRIKLYFYDKYSYILEEMGYEYYYQYKNIIDDSLVRGKGLMLMNMELRIISGLKRYKNIVRKNVEEEIRNLRCGKNADLELIKKYYSYIKELVYNKFCDKVTVCKKILIQEIDKKYEEYFNAAIINTINRKGEDIYLPKYINNRLSEHIRNKKTLYKIYYLDDEAFVMINNNVNLIDRYVKKYSRIISIDILKDYLEKEYYYFAYEYYTKKRARDYYSYIKTNLNLSIKEYISSYTDDQNDVKMKR